MYLIPATCELWIDGVRYPDGQPGEDDAEPFALADLVIRWGRSNTVDQPAPAQCSFTIMDPPTGAIRFDDTVALGSSVLIWSELDGNRSVVFAGRVTDLDATFDETAGAGVCAVVATDQMSDLGNRFVGAEPWPAEALNTRAQRIISAIGLDPAVVLGPIPVPSPGSLTVSRMDVDRQAAAGLLFELATSGGAVLWSSFNAATGAPYLIFENPANRASLYIFGQDLGTLLWHPMPGLSGGSPLSACQVLEDPVKWQRTITDLMTRATVRWQDQTTQPDPTERSVSLVNTEAEATYGSRGISIGTILTTTGDAQTLAARVLAGHQPSPQWRTEGLTWDLALSETNDPATRALALALLDNTRRLGYAIALTDLPYWTPTAAAVQLYIEGGTYTFDDGRWVLALQGSPATGLGSSLTYGQTDPSIRYADIDPAVQFLQTIGVGPAGPTGPRWSDIPTATTWASVPGTVKWSDDPR